jgi:hypothetical protein
MRKVLAVAAVLALGVGAYLLWPRAEEPTGREDAARAPDLGAAERMAQARERLAALEWAAAPLAPGEGSRVLRGQVHAPSGGPVAGALVVAAVAAQGDTLSELICQCGNRCGMKLLACGCGEAAGQIVSLVSARRGESVPVGRALTAEDGTFEIAGLDDRLMTVWAEKAGVGIGHPTSVSASSEPTVILSVGAPLAGRVVSEEGQPLSGAIVTAIFAEHSRFFDVISDVDGRFSYPQLPEGDFRLVAVSEPLLPEAERVRAGREHEVLLTLSAPRRISGRVVQDGAGVPGVEVSLDGNHRKETVRSGPDGRFGFEGLRKGSYDLIARTGTEMGRAGAQVGDKPETEVVLALGPSGAIVGYVRGEDGAPIAEARVWAHRRATSAHDDERSADAFSSAEGAYRIDITGGGEFDLSVSKEGFLDASTKAQLEPGQQAQAQAPDLVLVRAATLRGVVVDEAGAPIADAAIDLSVDYEALLESAGPDGRGARSRGGDATTGMDGTFEMTALDPQVPYEATISAKGFVTASVAVPPGTSEVRWVLERGATISGRVLDHGGAPLRGVKVAAHGSAEQRSGDTAVTSAEGRFVLSGLDGGEYMVVARREQSAEPSVGRAPASSVVRVPARGSADVVLRFTGAHALAGRAQSEDGAPVKGARLALPPRGTATHAEMGERALAASAFARSDAAGEFVFRDLPEGAYTLQAYARDQVPPPSLDVEIPATAPVVVTFGRRGKVVGSVVGHDGKPLVRFSVNHRPIRNPDGRFELPVRADGPMELSIGAPGHAYTSLEPQVSKTQVVDLGEIRLERGRTLRGRVVERGGAPAVGALVDVGPLKHQGAGTLYLAEQLGAVRTDANGRFELPSVGSVPVALVVQHDGHAEHRQELPPHLSDVSIQLRAGGRVQGFVAGKGGGPGVGAQIGAMTSLGEATATVGSDGRYELGGLAPGPVTIAVAHRSPGFPSYLARTVEVGEGQTVQVDFRPGPEDCDLVIELDAAASVHERRINAGLYPAATPAATSLKDLMARTTGAYATLQDGRLTFASVAPGEYVVEVYQFESEALKVSRVPVSVGRPCPQPIPISLSNPTTLAVDGMFE